MLQSSLIPFLQEKEEIEDAWLTQDDAQQHTAKTVLNYLQEIFDDETIPTTIAALEVPKIDETERIPVDMLVRTVNTFPKRLQKVIDLQGGENFLLTVDFKWLYEYPDLL